MSSLNKVQLIGNLGQDPEIRHTQSGQKIVHLSIATSERWKDKHTGEKRERTEWHRVVIFNEGLGGIIERYTSKGSKIYIEGQLQTRKWTDQSGNDRYTTEIVLQNYRGEVVLLSGNEGGGGGRGGRGENRSTHGADDYDRGGSSADLDDEIPF